MPPSSSGMNW